MDSGEGLESVKQFEDRKKDHIRIALDEKTQAIGQSGLRGIHLYHDALPQVSFSEITLNSQILHLPIKVPFYISGMTAGHEDAEALNYRLAEGCANRGWAMGVGSQRRELTDPLAGQVWKLVRKDFPELVLFSNIGLAQLIESWKDRGFCQIAHCRRRIRRNIVRG